MAPNPILKQILTEIEETKRSGGQTLAVFDLDSTLFDVSPRIQKIVAELAETLENTEEHRSVAEKLKGVVVEKSDWGIRSAVQRLGLHESHPELALMARDFWSQRFFSNEYLRFDQPYFGAVEYLRDLRLLGSEIVYLTGRDQIRMKEGSFQTLRDHGFPLDPPMSAELVLKPQKGQDDELFKSKWFHTVDKSKYSHIWFFENEPVNIEQVQRDHPEVKLVFFDSTHSGKSQSPQGLPVIKDYRLRF